MSAFEFFFSFYGLLLGLSVAALVGGFAEVLHERQRVRFGWLTPLMGTFVALDVATFWNQAWVFFRSAPYNHFLFILGLAVAGIYYVAASVTFPRLSAEGQTETINLDQHFWRHRRLVFGCVVLANLVMVALVVGLMSVNADFAALGTPQVWIRFAIFFVGMLLLTFAPWRRWVVAILTLMLLHSLWTVVTSAIDLFSSGGWSPAGAG